jgi:hypothetical protein
MNILDINDSNPRRGRIKTIPEIHVFKPWTIVGNIVKVLEDNNNAPMTTKAIFQILKDKHVVADSEKGLWSVRKAITNLQLSNTLISDQSVRKNNKFNEFGLELPFSINPLKKYKFKTI